MLGVGLEEKSGREDLNFRPHGPEPQVQFANPYRIAACTVSWLPGIPAFPGVSLKISLHGFKGKGSCLSELERPAQQHFSCRRIPPRCYRWSFQFNTVVLEMLGECLLQGG